MRAVALLAIGAAALAVPTAVRGDGCAVLGDATFEKWTYCGQNATLKGMNLGFKGPSAYFDNLDSEAAKKWEYIDLDTSKAKVDWSAQSKACKHAYMELACAWEIKPCKDPNGDSQKSINGGLRDAVISACADQSGAEIWTKPFPDDYRNSAFVFGLPANACLPDGTDCAENTKANGATCTADKDCVSATCTSGSCVGKANAAACTKGGECLSGVCTASKCAALPVGAECDTPAQCGSGKCDPNTAGSSDKKCQASSSPAQAVLSSLAAALVAVTAYAMA